MQPYRRDTSERTVNCMLRLLPVQERHRRLAITGTEWSVPIMVRIEKKAFLTELLLASFSGTGVSLRTSVILNGFIAALRLRLSQQTARFGFPER
jgi:hypothetical protein